MERANGARPLGVAVEDLPLEVFDLTGDDLAVESLTAGHGMGENDASHPDCVTCSESCGGGGGSCASQCNCTSCSVQRPTFSQEAVN